MEKKEIIGSVIGVLLMIGITSLMTSFLIPPSNPAFPGAVASITVVFVGMEIIRVLWLRRKRRDRVR